MTNTTYQIGDTITYNAAGELRTVVVVKKSDDIKNGEPGFVAELTDDECVWGYDAQIVRVVK